MSPNSRSGRIRRVIILASLQSPQFSPFEELIAAQARSVRSPQAHARRSESAVWSPLLRLLFDDVLTASAAMEWISCGICQLMLHLQKLCLQRACLFESWHDGADGDPVGRPGPLEPVRVIGTPSVGLTSLNSCMGHA